MNKISLMTSAWYNDRMTEFTFPEACKIDILRPLDADPLDTESIKRQIQDPSGSTLIEMAQGKQNIVFVVDDLGRPTPAAIIIPLVLDILFSASVKRNIKFIIATGSHRPLYKKELEKKLGSAIVEQYEVFSHDAINSPQSFIGYLDDGFPCYVNKEVAMAELLIGIGSVIPHSCHGFGGGAKLFLPGVAGIESIALMHGFLKKRGRSKMEPEGKDYDMRIVSEAFASMLPPIYDINVIVNSRREISGVFAGNYKDSFIKARDFAKEIYRTPIGMNKKKEYDIVVVNEYPLDADPVQSDKSFWVKKFFPNSLIIHLNECSDGLDYHGWKEMRKKTNLSKYIVGCFRFVESSEYVPSLIRKFYRSFPVNLIRKYLFKKFVFVNKIDFNRYYIDFQKQKSAPEYNAKPSTQRRPWFYSKNYPPLSFYKKYKNGCLIQNWQLIFEFIRDHYPNAKIGILTCAPMQIPEIK